VISSQGGDFLMQSKKKSVFKGLFWVLLICGVLVFFAFQPLSEGEFFNPYAGATKLIMAVIKKSDPRDIIALVKAGEDVNARDKRGTTALWWAARNPNPDVITALLDLGANPKVYDIYGTMPMDLARTNRELENTEALRKLEEMTAMMLDINDANDFFAICKYGSIQQVNDAIKAGADVNTMLMHVAGVNSDPEVIAALIEAGAKVNQNEPAGRTPLMFAAGNNTNPEVIMTLLKFGADAKAKDNSGSPVMAFAKGNKNLINTEAFRILEEASR
jgi:ankyrin repeat protein